MRLPSLDAIRSGDLHDLLYRPIRKLLRQSLHREGQYRFFKLSHASRSIIMRSWSMIDVCLQGKQVYAERQLKRIKAAEARKQLGGAVTNGTVMNGHANGYTNGVSKKKTQ